MRYLLYYHAVSPYARPLAGVELMLYFWTVWLIRNGNGRDRKSNMRFLYFSTGLLCMITIQVAVQAVFGQEMWIVHADYPGGSGQYLADNAAVWYQTLGSAASIVLNLMSDGLLVSSCAGSPYPDQGLISSLLDLPHLHCLERLACLYLSLYPLRWICSSRHIDLLCLGVT